MLTPEVMAALGSGAASVIIVALFLKYMREYSRDLNKVLTKNTEVLGKVLHALDRENG